MLCPCGLPDERGRLYEFVFLSLEDETGISSVIVNPDLYEKHRVVINRENPSRGRPPAESGSYHFHQGFPRPTHFDNRCGNAVPRFSLTSDGHSI